MCNCNWGGCGRGGFQFGTTVTGTQTRNGTCTCGYWNGVMQRMCRDVCGNILTRNTNNGCGCHQHCCCPCWRPCQCCGCGNGNNTTTGNNGATGNNGTGGNGVFRCITFCGYGNNLTQTTGTNDATAYYARQYGLTCDDNAECVYTF